MTIAGAAQQLLTQEAVRSAFVSHGLCTRACSTHSAGTAGPVHQNFVGRRRSQQTVTEARAGWLEGTERLTSSACAALPGVLLKSPATSIGMSALTAIFSRPFSSVCTCNATV